jgi:zinc finger SWIM domain-containing protein 3
LAFGEAGSILKYFHYKIVDNPSFHYELQYECCLLLENALDSLGPQLEDKLNASSSATVESSNDQENVDPNVELNEQQTTDFLNATQLKKKVVQSKNSKRAKTWIDKLHKGKHKGN